MSNTIDDFALVSDLQNGDVYQLVEGGVQYAVVVDPKGIRHGLTANKIYTVNQNRTVRVIRRKQKRKPKMTMNYSAIAMIAMEVTPVVVNLLGDDHDYIYGSTLDEELNEGDIVIIEGPSKNRPFMIGKVGDTTEDDDFELESDYDYKFIVGKIEPNSGEHQRNRMDAAIKELKKQKRKSNRNKIMEAFSVDLGQLNIGEDNAGTQSPQRPKH